MGASVRVRARLLRSPYPAGRPAAQVRVSVRVRVRARVRVRVGGQR